MTSSTISRRLRHAILAAMIAGFVGGGTQLTPLHAQDSSRVQHTLAPAATGTIKKVLFIGDSMTGWLAERLGAYGAENGFEVSTIVWDGSTIRKWGGSTKLKSIIDRENPDAVFISLGLNELLESNPARLKTPLDNIIKAVGKRRLVWIGPPSWPGKGKGEKLTGMLANTLGANRFFNSSDLTIKRQSKTNPHPTRQATVGWGDRIVTWLKNNKSLKFQSLNKPVKRSMVRGKSFRYLRMRDKL